MYHQTVRKVLRLIQFVAEFLCVSESKNEFVNIGISV